MLDRPTAAFGIAFAIAALLNGMLTVAKEMLPGLLAWMSALTGDPWMTQSLLSMAVFFIGGAALLLLKPQTSAHRLTLWLAGSTIVSAAFIAGTFLVK
jgi:hypothetical protein